MKMLGSWSFIAAGYSKLSTGSFFILYVSSQSGINNVVIKCLSTEYNEDISVKFYRRQEIFVSDSN